MSQYVIITPEGNRFGPADFQTLSQWAAEGRVMPGMMVQDVLSQTTTTASAVPGLTFGPSPDFMNYPRATQADPASGRGKVALVLGLVGLLAWCLPVVGLPVGIAAVVFGTKGLRGSNRQMATAGLALGLMCIILSIVNVVLGTMIVMNGFG